MFEELTLEILEKENKSFEEKKVLNRNSNVKIGLKLHFKTRKKQLLVIIRNFLSRNQFYSFDVLSIHQKKATSPRFHPGYKTGIKLSTKKKECPRCKIRAEKTYLGKMNRVTCFCSNCQALFG